MRSFDLSGRTALVIGATGFLGRTLSMAFADAGADVVLCSRTESSLKSLADQIRDETGRRAAVVVADLTDKEDTSRVAGEALAAFGTVDIVVCNAAPVMAEIATGTILETSEEDWRRFYDVIFWSPLRILRGLLPSMMERGMGSVITMCSSSGNTPVPGIDAYGMAKGNLQLMTKYFAKECGDSGVRVNGLLPAGLITDPAEEPFVRQSMAENGLLARLSLSRLGQLEDMIGPVLFLASDHSSYITGQVLNVDGGRL